MGNPLHLIHCDSSPSFILFLGWNDDPGMSPAHPWAPFPRLPECRSGKFPSPRCSQRISLQFSCESLLYLSRAAPAGRAGEPSAGIRNSRRSAKALRCCRSPRADKTHPDCTLLHPWHCIPACELINEPRNLLGLALGVTEWVWVFQTVNP